MQLLDTRGANPKLKKTGAAAPFRYAGLSLYPDAELCPGSKAAGCLETCLAEQGRGRFNNVREARQNKKAFFREDRAAFLDQLHRELFNFTKLCDRTGERGAVRLNVLSDFRWETLGIPQAHPDLLFVDYTKRVARLGKTPDNYRLIFSYSGRTQYRKQFAKALKTSLPIAVVFRGGLPAKFLGRPVIDGDRDDIANAYATGQIVGLSAKGSARHDRTGFVIDNPDLIGTD
jgi:hypothetical protein